MSDPILYVFLVRTINGLLSLCGLGTNYSSMYKCTTSCQIPFDTIIAWVSSIAFESKSGRLEVTLDVHA